jgi:acetyl esterase/lipase
MFRMKVSDLLAVVVVLVCVRVCAETASPPPAAAMQKMEIWPDGAMPGVGAKEAERELPMREDGFHRITNVSRPSVEVFPSARKDTAAPAVIVCPGGAYSYVVHDKEGTEIASWLNREGYTALVLKYRVPNNREGALQDLQRCISLARARANEWKIDPARVGVMGFSAGGNLAAKASTRFDQRSYPAVDAVDQQSCRPDFTVLVYPAYLEKDGAVSPDLNLKAHIPPTLIVHNDDDKALVGGSVLYDAALTEAKVPHQFLHYQTGGHGYGLHCTGEAKVWPGAAMEWLRKLEK